MGPFSFFSKKAGVQQVLPPLYGIKVSQKNIMSWGQRTNPVEGYMSMNTVHIFMKEKIGIGIMRLTFRKHSFNFQIQAIRAQQQQFGGIINTDFLGPGKINASGTRNSRPRRLLGSRLHKRSPHVASTDVITTINSILGVETLLQSKTPALYVHLMVSCLPT
ncbi:hypothetical protein EX30DRAFT_339838 [Ascodesmis nigricans]|uniref:Uncharacterized protein n=1 Tax=Ascodesmis nigricans TaxID=341454 RepID=A0A4S2N0T9_9PEZI|nr:hypothetical protein EX30DRAFT_339838 [Ascodesmis nigricans]